MNELMGPATEPFFTRWAADVLLGLTLLLSGATLASLVFGRNRPAFRHALWLGVLFVALALPFVSAITQPIGWTWIPIPHLQRPPLAGNGPATANSQGSLIDAGDRQNREGSANRAELTQTPIDVTRHTGVDEAALSRNSISSRGSDPIEGRIFADASLAGSRLSLTLCLIGIWFTGLLLILVWRGIGWSRLQRVRLEAEPLDEESYGSVLGCIRRLVPLNRDAPIVVSSLARVPLVSGLWRPLIILPRRMLQHASEAALTQTLIHERAHLHRNDHWVLALERLATMLFWPHPLIHWMSRELDRAREEVCDNHVLAASNPAEYAETLFGLAQLCLPLPGTSTRLSVLRGHHRLPCRIQLLLDRRRDRRTDLARGSRIALSALVGLLGMLAVLFRTGSPVGAADPPATDEEVDEVSELVQALVTYPASTRTNRGHTREQMESWAAQIHRLNRIGTPAVPVLIDALDRTEEDMPLRLLGFTLRSMGDPRAVPALIRAIPKTLRAPGSDFGLLLSDHEMLRFMQAYDLDEENHDTERFSLGRPVREIFGALRKLTGTSHGEEELYSVVLSGAPGQRELQRRLYLETAARWAAWWNDNGRTLVREQEFVELRLPELQQAAVGGPFHTHANLKVDGGYGNVIVTPVTQRNRDSLLDLDTSRSPDWPDEFSGLNQEVSIDSLSAWAAREGVDLMGIEFTPPDSSRSYYCLRGVGLQAWQIPNSRWDTIEEELASGDSLELGPPTGDLLMHFDTEQAGYAPMRRATFLFQTREGAQGILRIVAQVTRLYPPKGPYRVPMVSGDDPASLLRRRYGLPAPKGEPIPQDQDDHDIGFKRGVKIEYRWFSPTE